MRKSGFTLVEFTLCLIMMFVIMGAVISIPMKKAKQSLDVFAKGGKIERLCGEYAPGTIIDFEIENPGSRYEFFEITLIGGGAAGSNVNPGTEQINTNTTTGLSRGGAAGEVKKIVYPTMQGEYALVIGAGGKVGEKGNGSATVLYKKVDDTRYELIEYAAGGITSNEVIHRANKEATMDNETKKKLNLGDDPAFDSGDSTGSIINCGKGGKGKGTPPGSSASASAEAGIDGGMVITW